MIEQIESHGSNGAGAPIDPVRARLLEIGGPDDTRADSDLLDEIGSIADVLVKRVEGREQEGRKGAAWQELDRLRQATAENDEVAPALARAIDVVRKQAGVPEPPPPLPDPAQTVLALLNAPEAGHVHTALPTLDGITDGGLYGGKFHVIAGEPNVGKTSLAVQLARAAIDDGWVVGFHVADVDNREGIQLRIAQSHGIDRRAFLRHEVDALTRTAEIISGWAPRFAITDEAADGITIDEAARALLAVGAATKRRVVLFVDSLQTISLRWQSEPRTDKEKIDKVVKRLVEWTRRGLTVVATCEIPRGFYTGPKKTKGPRQAPPALAAFKGSGNIEYAMWTGMVITRIRGETDAVRVEVPKNKQGREDVTFRLVRTASRVGYDDDGEMWEGGADEADDMPRRKPAENLDLEPYRLRIRKCLAGRPSGYRGNRDELATLAGGKTKLTRAAIADMLTSGELLAERPEGEPARLRLRRSDEPRPTSSAND